MASDLNSIVSTLSNLTVLELNDLRKKLEESWDVKAVIAAAAVTGSANINNAGEEVQQKTEFDIELVAIVPEKKINLIKLLRELNPTLGLTEAKAVVESLPKNIKEGVSEKEANEIKAKLEAAGASTVNIK